MDTKKLSKQLYKKHLKLCTPKGYQSEKQMLLYRQEATIDAIEEALSISLSSEEEE